MCVSWNCLFGWDPLQRLEREFCYEMKWQEATSPDAICGWVRQCHDESCITCKKPPVQPSSVRTPENISTVRGNLQVSTLKCQACLTEVFGASCLVIWIFTHTNCKLCIFLMIGTKRYVYKYVLSFGEYWLKILTCQTTFWWVMRQIFICMAQLISRTFDTCQLKILTNFIIVPFMTQKVLFSVLFGPVESLDPTSLRMKTYKLSQSYHNNRERW